MGEKLDMRNVTSCAVYEVVLERLSKMGFINSAQVGDKIDTKCYLENEVRYHLEYLGVD
jgi:ribosomal protein S8